MNGAEQLEEEKNKEGKRDVFKTDKALKKKEEKNIVQCNISPYEVQKHEKSDIYISKLVVSVKAKGEAGNWAPNLLCLQLVCCQRNSMSVSPDNDRKNCSVPEKSHSRYPT